MADYLRYFPQPLLDDLVKNQCLPIIGAGFSRNASVPLGRQIPLWDDLGKALAGQMRDYPYTTPLDAISAYSHQFSRPKLVEQLTELLLVEIAQPGPVHKAFCSLPFDIVCTTNFDFLIENAYSFVGRYCRPIITEGQLSLALQRGAVTLLKLHGDLHHPEEMVVTEANYDAFLERNPLLATYMANLLISRTPIFIGYSLEDPDFRQLWQLIRDRLGELKRAAYALSINATPSTIARFQRRGVKLIDLPVGRDSYGHVLESVFSELKEYWDQESIKLSTVTEERALGDLSMPRDAMTRLCYFSLPVSIYSFYRSVVFPIAQASGFNPITAEDIISPGENILAKVSAIIDRCELIVADLGSGAAGVLAELEIARSRGPKTRRILVVAEAKPSAVVENINVILRPKDPQIHSGDFLGQVNRWFQEVALSLRPALSEEPRRLLDKREYRSAVISAITVLEAILREKLSESRGRAEEFVYPAQSLIPMLREAERLHIVSSTELESATVWIQIRNRAVHSSADVRENEAKAVVEGVLGIVDRLRSTSTRR